MTQDKLAERREIEMLRREVMQLRRENNLLHAPVMTDDKFIPPPPTPTVFPQQRKRRKQTDAVTVIYQSGGSFWLGFGMGVVFGGIVLLGILAFIITNFWRFTV